MAVKFQARYFEGFLERDCSKAFTELRLKTKCSYGKA
jgi:hypothetical protein